MPHIALVTYLVRNYDEAIAWFSRALGFRLTAGTYSNPELTNKPPLGGLQQILLNSTDFVFHAQLPAFDIGKLGIGCGRMGHRIRQLHFESVVLANQFIEVVPKAHSNLHEGIETQQRRHQNRVMRMTQN
jgi:catechol 2,3-dioxygenase-like lactoylglutathione lyase family enzyme